MGAQHGRDRWYPFFADLGFLILPCGFNWHGTTSWLFDREDGEVEESLGDERFTIRHTNMNYFFYRIDHEMLKQALGTMRLTERLIRTKARREGIELGVGTAGRDGMEEDLPAPPNASRFEGEAYLEGFSLVGYLRMLAGITNEIDPMRWAEQGVTPNYLGDFDTYGFCFLDIEATKASARRTS